MVRGDFSGGWKEDPQNKFTAQGRTEKENEVFNWTRNIANYRKSSDVLKKGKLMQYLPDHGVYTYFRYNNDKTVMIIMNTGEKERMISVDRFSERTNKFTKAVNIINSESKDITGEWTIPGNTIWIMELHK